MSTSDPFGSGQPVKNGVDEQSRLDAAMRRADQLLVQSLQGDERRRHKRVLYLVLLGGAIMLTGLCAVVSILTLPGSVESGAANRAAGQGAVANAAETVAVEKSATSVDRVELAAADTANAERASQLSQEGWQQWAQQNYTGAATKFEEAVKLDPRNSNAWNGLGWANLNAGKDDRAREAFLAVLKLEPKHPAALNGMGQMALADRNYDEAEKYLVKAAAAPDASAAWYGLTRLYLIQGKYAQAEKWAKKTVASGDPDGSAQQMLDAAKAKQLPDFLKGEAAPPAKIESTVNANKEVGQALRLMNQGRREEAKALFTSILAKAPQNGAALNGMGWLLLGGGEVDEAKGYFEKVLAAEPLAGGAMNGMARVLKAQGDEAGAIKIWQEMVDKIPGTHAGTSGLADVYLEKKDYAKALPLFEQLAKANPGDEATQKKLAQARAGTAK